MALLYRIPRLRRQGDCACSQSRIACTLHVPINEVPSGLRGEWVAGLSLKMVILSSKVEIGMKSLKSSLLE